MRWIMLMALMGCGGAVVGDTTDDAGSEPCTVVGDVRDGCSDKPQICDGTRWVPYDRAQAVECADN